ncbi:phosphatases II [Pelomyxa schiedti]|nr:phosphatases II [Pelomyxa schiedti]
MNATSASVSSLPTPPSLIEYDKLKFLIFDAPSDENLSLYVQEFKKYNVRHVVRVCDPTYEEDALAAYGFILHWLCLVNKTFLDGNPFDETLGVHCVAGLGRAPVLVALALIEHGMPALAAVQLIRSTIPKFQAHLILIVIVN